MKNKKALIIGVTGQDGSYLAELLLEKKYKVHAILRKVSLKKNKNRFWRINEFKKKIIFHNASLNEYKKLSNLIKKIKPHEIYHLAAQSYINYRFDDEFFQLNPNINGTHYILSAIKDYSPKSKFYFASSSEMFGNVNSFPQNENTKLNPRSAYGISKVAGYQLTKNYREAHNIFACTGILYNHESSRRGINFVTKKIVNGVAKIHLKKKKKIILGDINAKRDWGYAGDYVLAMWKMLQQSKPSDYVIGTGKLHSVKDFLRIAFEYVGLNYKNYIKIDKKLIRPKDNAILKANIFKAKKYLKWRPKVSFKNLVIDMIKSEIKLLQNNKTGK
jgi:GDPmannose 4,6-dehydratase